jgi:integrase
MPSGRGNRRWRAAETGARAGELTALRVSDVDLDNLYVEISKALWCGAEDTPKTEAGNRSICISARLGAALKEYLAGREEGYLFQTTEGGPWDASNILVRKLNKLLTQLEIPKIDPKILAKIIGKGRTIEQATRSEKRGLVGATFFPPHEQHGDEFFGYPAADSQAAPWLQQQWCDRGLHAHFRPR